MAAAAEQFAEVDEIIYKEMLTKNIKKGTLIFLKDQPCKIVDCSSAKVGKHGAAKVMCKGVNMLSGKTVEETNPEMWSPIVTKIGQMVLSCEIDDGQYTLSVMDDEGLVRDFVAVHEEVIEQVKKVMDANPDDICNYEATIFTCPTSFEAKTVDQSLMEIKELKE